MLGSPSLTRLVIAVVVGAAVGVGVGVATGWAQGLLAGWIAFALVELVWIGLLMRRADGPRTRQLATREDDQRIVTDALLLTASAASLGGAGLALHTASRVSDGRGVALTITAVATVVVSWLLVNAHYALRYAHLYYAPPEGGVDFPGADTPDYRDFLYLSLTIGMTYQVSDTGLLTPKFRRALLAHALLAYLFGAVIVATVVNVVAGLVA